MRSNVGACNNKIRFISYEKEYKLFYKVYKKIEISKRITE